MRHLLPLVACCFAGFTQAQVQVPEYSHYLGAWQGPFLFYVMQQDTGAQGPPAVHAGTMQVDADGKVRGSVPGAGCTITGSGTDYVSPANASVELDLSACSDTRFNGHYSGKLINNPQLKYASLRMSSMRSLDAGSAQVSAIMRR